MKNIFCFFLMILASFSITQAQYDTPAKQEKYLLDLTLKYSPDAYEILNAAKGHYLEYVEGANSREEIMGRFGTTVHEACHHYNFIIGSGWDTYGYFIGAKNKLAVKTIEVFNSTELNKTVSKDWQNKIFRYKTYIGEGLEGGKVQVASQTKGIFGMLDEFTAYYHGAKAELELRKYYETFCPYKDAACWVDSYLTHSQSDIYAYYEFNLFMSWYLRHAQKKYPKMYQSFLENKNLRVAYTLLDDLYKKLVDTYFTNRQAVIKKMTEAGKLIELTDEYIYIVTVNGNSKSKSGSGIPDDDIKYLKSLYTTEDTQMLESFKIKGVNLTNYTQFLQK